MRDLTKEVFQRGVKAPHRLLFDKNEDVCLRIYHHRIVIACGSHDAGLDGVRDGLLSRGLITAKLLASAPDPSTLAPKQQLAISRADIRRRAKLHRPRLKKP